MAQAGATNHTWHRQGATNHTWHRQVPLITHGTGRCH